MSMCLKFEITKLCLHHKQMFSIMDSHAMHRLTHDPPTHESSHYYVASNAFLEPQMIKKCNKPCIVCTVKYRSTFNLTESSGKGVSIKQWKYLGLLPCIIFFKLYTIYVINVNAIHSLIRIS